MTEHKIVNREDWIAARKELLAQEKEATRALDRLAAARRALPWVRVEKEYRFQGSEGEETLGDLFAGRGQLVVYHFMFAPEWDSGCKSCSFWADNIERNVVHLNARDVSFAAISRAPLQKLDAFRRRLGWTFKWVSSEKNDFNFDYRVSATPEERAQGEMFYNYRPLKTGMTDLPGISVFYRDADGAIYHTYSCYGRGLDMMNAAYRYLDLVPMGRNEAGLKPAQAWVRYRDSYGA
ncbi:MAG TPA: DUF899 domain-containing protein [Stellaceae bacterium]|nr:DUF899 domain-containing protein [Stellaceae bacterium]